MLKIHVLPLGDYQTNCYIVHEENSTDCLIIDPGYEPEIISSYLEEKGLTPEAILLTHCHFDHVGAVKDLAAQYDCKVFLDKKELAMPPMLTNGPLYYTDGYGDGDTLTLAAGHLGRKLIQNISDFQIVSQLLQPLAAFCFGYPMQGSREQDVFPASQVVQQFKVLE